MSRRLQDNRLRGPFLAGRHNRLDRHRTTRGRRQGRHPCCRPNHHHRHQGIRRFVGLKFRRWQGSCRAARPQRCRRTRRRRYRCAAWAPRVVGRSNRTSRRRLCPHTRSDPALMHPLYRDKHRAGNRRRYRRSHHCPCRDAERQRLGKRRLRLTTHRCRCRCTQSGH